GELPSCNPPGRSARRPPGRTSCNPPARSARRPYVEPWLTAEAALMMHASPTRSRSFSAREAAVLSGLGASLLWAYWPTLGDLVGRWSNDPRYSHGYLVPPFAAVLLWLRRRQLAAGALRPSGWGLPLLAAGGG